MSCCYRIVIYHRWFVVLGILHVLVIAPTHAGPEPFPKVSARGVQLILYQGKTRYEITGRSCPLGIKFIKPESFSCACVAGAWAFYDMKCAAPYQIIAGLNHCFKLPPNVFFHQIINVGNPTRSHGNSLAFFDGELEAVRTKFYRETHSRMNTTDQVLTTGHAWTLRSLNEKLAICLNGAKNSNFRELDSTMPSSGAYCIYSNVTSYIGEIGSVSTGCEGTVKKKLAPQSCFPFLGTNSEDICTHSSVIQTYEDALRVNRTAPFGSLPAVTRTVAAQATREPSAHDSEDSLIVAPDRKATENAGEDQRIDPLISALDDLREPDNDLTLRQSRTALNVEHSDAGLLPTEDMHKRYMSTVQNEENFLKPQGEASDAVIFQVIMDHQRMRIREALKHEEPQETLDSNVELLLRKSSDIMARQCPNVQQEFLNIAIHTFARLLRRLNYQHKLVHSIDMVLRLLDECETKHPPYEFVPTAAPCEKNVPTHVLVGGKALPIDIPEVYKSAKFEPIVETVWKLTVHTLLYCSKELSKHVDPATEMAIAFSEMLSSDLNVLWKRDRDMEEEYSGVIGDMRKIMENIDACVTTAALHTRSKLLYARPVRKPTVPPDDADEQSRENLEEYPPKSAESSGKERKRARRETRNLMAPEDEMWRKDRQLFGIGYCLKKFDEPFTHFDDSNCDGE